MAKTLDEINAKRREHYQRNREKLLEQYKKYRANPIAKENKKLYDSKRVRIRNDKKYSEYTEEEKERKRSRERVSYAKNKEKVKARQKAYRASEEGRKKELERAKRYRKTEKGKELNRRTSTRLHHQRRALEKDMSRLDIFVFNEAYDIRVRREKLFGIKWNIDHIIPVTKGGNNAYTNIQVVPASWNFKKGNRHSERFFI